MTNGEKLLLTYPNLYVCVLYFDPSYIHLRDRNINYKMDDKKTCIKIPMDWWDAEYKAERSDEK